MKKITTIIALSAVAFANAQTALYNNGDVLYISAGAAIQVNGDFTNASGGTFTNNGSVTVTGNFSNSQAMGTYNLGSMVFKGTATQTLGGSASFYAKDVTINNAAGVTVNSPLRVDGVFSFTNGIITAATAANAITFTTNGTVSGTNVPTDASHVNGYVVKEGTGAFVYPVGDVSNYQPVGLNLTANGSGTRVKYNASDAGAAPFTTTGSEPTALVAYNKLEYWDIAPLTNATGTVTINWDSYNNIGINNTSDLKVAHQSGGNWLNEGGTGSGTVTNGSVTSNSVSAWSPFTLGSINNSSVLPLHLLSFSGSNKTGYNQLQWQTANELNTNIFEVEMAMDNVQWAAIGTVAAKGSGNNTYSFSHNSPPKGQVFYRLKMVDNDGKFTYSDVIFVTSNNKISITGYPNPATNAITLNVGDTYLKSIVQLYGLDGKLLQNIVLQNTQQLINISTFGKGVYTLRFSDGTALKFIKQ